MRCSLRLNNDLRPADYVALAHAAERHGFDQLWISNDLFLRSAPVLLTAVVQATERIEVGTGILNPHTIHPAELAMLAATLDELSGGRFNLGLGAGAADFLGWVGIDDARPVATMREAIVDDPRLARRRSRAGRPLRPRAGGRVPALHPAPRDADLPGRDGARRCCGWPASWPTARCPCSSRPSTGPRCAR